MMGSGGFGFGWIWMLVLLIGFGALVWGLVRAASSSGNSNTGGAPGGGDRSREILRERYARGEISEEEMRERTRTLDGP